MGASISWRERREGRGRAFGEMIGFGGGRSSGTGYMAFADRVGPGVLVVHESFGLQPSVLDFCDALRAEGFTVLAPDLFDGVVAATMEEADSLAASLDVDRTLRRLRAAGEHLTLNWHPRLGAVGFSSGAALAGELAQEGLLDATVLYYGLGELDPARWRGPLLGHFAARDDRIPLEAARQRFEELCSVPVEAEMQVHPGGHRFANAAAPDAYNEEAAEIAWLSTVDFLTYHLA